ncbi:MAG: methyltransferase domain-containing protein [Anaerolineae bacterium]|nr:methyltransferase domain-containing protein [Anaerolineae bacterium]
MSEALIDRQQRQPAGLLGRLIGPRLTRDQRREYEWALGLLDPQATDHILHIGDEPGLISRRGRVVRHQADVTTLPFPDQHFNKVLCSRSLYAWPRPLAGLRELHRVLGPGGVLVLAIQPTALWHTASPGTPDDAGEVLHLLRTAGFTRATIRATGDPAYPAPCCVVAVKEPHATRSRLTR